MQWLIWPLFILKLASLFFPYYKDFQNTNQIFYLHNNNNFPLYNHSLPQNIFLIFNLKEKGRMDIFWCVWAYTLYLPLSLSFSAGLAQREYGCLFLTLSFGCWAGEGVRVCSFFFSLYLLFLFNPHNCNFNKI